MSTTLTGGCLCGGVRFEVTGPWIRASHCHCERCRRHSGTAMLTQGRVRREHFRLLQGAELVRAYREERYATKAVLLGLRLEPVRRRLAPRRRGVDPPRVDRRRPGDPAAVPYLHRLEGAGDEICDGLPQYPERYTPGSA